MKIPDHIKEDTEGRERIHFECCCGGGAGFEYPLNMKKNKWWFEGHKDCPKELEGE